MDGEKEGRQRVWKWGTQLPLTQHCLLIAVGHRHSRVLKPSPEASQRELKPRGAEERLTGGTARGLLIKAQLSKSIA